MKTLKIQLPIGLTLVQSILLLIVVLLMIEVTSRTNAAKSIFGKYEFYGSAHPHFDRQLVNIKERERKEGHIDCIFIGNSQVLYGINPEVVEQSYFDKTGKKIICQNFGLGGITFFSALPIINILIDTYHPSVILLGTSLFDFATIRATGGDNSITLSPWVKYQLGEFTVDGWLIENSSSYRYYLGVDHYLLNSNEFPVDLLENGYSYRDMQATISIEKQKEYFDNILPSPLVLQEESFTALRGILKLQSSKLDIFIVEIPLTFTIFEMRPRSINIHSDFTSLLIEEADMFNAKVLLSQDIIEIPENGWYDIYHLNNAGTYYLSKIIGEQLGEINLYH